MNSPASIILVEDYDELRETMADYLRLAGFVVTAVGNGLEFYEKIARQVYAVALIDLGLPDQNGEILVEYVRRNTTSAIIVVSGEKSCDSRIKCYNIGADLFLGKPFDYGELTAAVASLANRMMVSDSVRTTPPVRADSPDAGVWQLLKKSRRLLVPDGAAIELTASECDLLCCLSEGTHPVSRDVLQTTLRQVGSAGTVRALESLVRRTRKKIAGHTRHRVPILSNYGLGYAFAAKLIVVQ